MNAAGQTAPGRLPDRHGHAAVAAHDGRRLPVRKAGSCATVERLVDLAADHGLTRMRIAAHALLWAMAEPDFEASFDAAVGADRIEPSEWLAWLKAYAVAPRKTLEALRG